jgi:hypothetical protein
MIWIAPSEKDTDTAALEKRLWDAAGQFRDNSGLKAQEYSATVLGLILLRFRSFREKVSPMLELLNVLLQKEESLRRTRDLLLPRLLSGQRAL